ncbi:hypothetical protein SAMN04487962_1585 [Marinobacter segnicrescens]|uniref:Sporulation related domain-containing protein n=1 Tax=Marinobacter segnicrescens TaxID=430453 RepID=A0A1I0IFA2_9GAMM|nr:MULTISPECIES: SPOR domain-containing protein [Marinobacter]UZD65103.1 SPOR domain-containing protein [Marinobacter sp. AN1]SET94699.1 hypothetical protein SAMN04487962_1585 [Marinobacter segnicrescens]
MRWVALLLLLINIGLFWWLSSSGQDNVRPVQEGKLPRVAEIKLIDEWVNGQAEPREDEASSRLIVDATEYAEGSSDALMPPGSGQAGPESAAACYGIGWFNEQAEALAYRNEMLVRFPSLRFGGVQERSEELEPFHWVIIPPLPSRDEAMALYRELVNKGIEAYVVPSGENENAISLGLFRSRVSAERILSERQAENIDATLVKFPRNRISYALVFEGVPQPELQGQGLPPAKSDAELQLIEFSDCEGVATAKKNP